MWKCPNCDRTFKKTNQNHFCGGINTIDDYIEHSIEEHRGALYRVRDIIAEAIPNVAQKLYWKMPSFWHNGSVIFIAARKQSLAFYPGSEAIPIFTEQLSSMGLKVSKGAILFPWNQPIPYDLIKEIVMYRLL